MPSLKVVNDVLRACDALAQDGQNREALRVLDGLLEEARQQGQPHMVELVSRHAAEISEPLGDLPLVARYRQAGLESAPNNAAIQYAMADVLSRLGKPKLALEHAAKSYRLLANSSTQQDRELVYAILLRWPQASRYLPAD